MEHRPPVSMALALGFVLALGGGTRVWAQGRPPVVSVVYPETSEWFAYTPNDSAVAVTGTNPRAGRGSLELTKLMGNGSAFINEGRVFGTLGTLTTFSLDFFVDPAST